MCKLILTAGLCLIMASLASSSRLVCFYNGTVVGNEDEGKLKMSYIDPDMCSHLIYGTSRISEDFELIPILDGKTGDFKTFNKLKKSNQQLKTLLDVDLNLETQNFREMATSTQHREDFLQQAIKQLRKFEFDGVNLSWEYTEQSQPEDKDAFTLLCQGLQAAFEAEGTSTGEDRLILTASVSADVTTIDSSYDIPQLASHLDFINVLTFDFYNPSEGITRHHSPLFRGNNDKDADFSMRYWRDKGAPSQKLNLGVAAYGRAFTLYSEDNGVGARTRGAGEEGCYTGHPGMWAYFETCLYLEGVENMTIAEQKVPYATVEDQWVGYEDKDSIAAKVDYVALYNFGGVFVSSLNTDDFSGEFCNQGEFPLISHLHDLLL